MNNIQQNGLPLGALQSFLMPNTQALLPSKLWHWAVNGISFNWAFAKASRQGLEALARLVDSGKLQVDAVSALPAEEFVASVRDGAAAKRGLGGKLVIYFP